MRWDRRDRYETVFFLLMASFVLGAVVTGPRARIWLLVLYATALLMAVHTVPLTRMSARLLRIVLGVGSVAIGFVALVAADSRADAALALWLATVLLATILAILWRVLHHRTVSLQTIFGALSAYLLIGFFFTAVYGPVAYLGPDPFFAGGQPVAAPTLQYFSFVTLTTTGYGDLVPQGNLARSLAVLEALVGQIFLVTLVARLVAMFGLPRQRLSRTSEAPDVAPGAAPADPADPADPTAHRGGVS